VFELVAVESRMASESPEVCLIESCFGVSGANFSDFDSSDRFLCNS
jgi:hypothetical protein